jgi:hypothetical protein
MRVHEISCVRNPNRGCSMCGLMYKYVLADVISEMKKRDDVLISTEIQGFDEDGPIPYEKTSKEAIAWLETQVGGCPLCMLAVLMQSGIWAQENFNFKERKGNFVNRFDIFNA